MAPIRAAGIALAACRSGAPETARPKIGLRPRAIPPTRPGGIGDYGGMPRTVLVIDDSAAFRSTARMLLQARGYEVVGLAVDVATGLAAVAEMQPDCVLLDVNLPDGDGLAVAAELTADGAAPAVVLVSTLDASALGDVTRSGARGFVPKSELASPLLVELLGPP